MSASVAASSSLRMVRSRRSSCVRRTFAARHHALTPGQELSEAARAPELGVERAALERDAPIDDDRAHRAVASG